MSEIKKEEKQQEKKVLREANNNILYFAIFLVITSLTIFLFRSYEQKLFGNIFSAYQKKLPLLKKEAKKDEENYDLLIIFKIFILIFNLILIIIFAKKIFFPSGNVSDRCEEIAKIKETALLKEKEERNYFLVDAKKKLVEKTILSYYYQKVKEVITFWKKEYYKYEIIRNFLNSLKKYPQMEGIYTVYKGALKEIDVFIEYLFHKNNIEEFKNLTEKEYKNIISKHDRYLRNYKFFEMRCPEILYRLKKIKNNEDNGDIENIKDIKDFKEIKNFKKVKNFKELKDFDFKELKDFDFKEDVYFEKYIKNSGKKNKKIKIKNKNIKNNINNEENNSENEEENDNNEEKDEEKEDKKPNSFLESID